VTSTGNAGSLKEETYNGIPNVTLWPELRKRLQLKAYKLFIVRRTLSTVTKTPNIIFCYKFHRRCTFYHNCPGNYYHFFQTSMYRSRKLSSRLLFCPLFLQAPYVRSSASFVTEDAGRYSAVMCCSCYH
jgi:hypothetical protein